MDSYSWADRIYLIDTDDEFFTNQATTLKAFVTSEGNLEIKILTGGKLTKQMTYHGKFLVHWRVDS